jgi:hypothetical protein
MSKYVSSIINKYGDIEHVSRDSKTVTEIQARQGNTFLIDLIAEHSGTIARKFSMSDEDRGRLVESLVNELKTALLERL